MRHDPWVVAGLVALTALSAGVVGLYRSAPQSVEQVRTRTWLAARPDAYAPNLARARESLRRAESTAVDSVAAAEYAAAAEHAWRARGLAATPQEAGDATGAWGEALLGWAERLRTAGTGTGLRSDENETLRQALALVNRVLAVQTPPPVRARAEALRDQLERQLRPGPLEWLPLPR